MGQSIPIHIEGPIKGSRLYLSLTMEEWDEYSQICKDNPTLTQLECFKLLTKDEPKEKK